MDVDRVVVTFTLKVKTDPLKPDYDGRILESNIDTCKLRQGFPFANLVVNFLMDQVKKYSNFQLECPQKKNDFYVRNLPAPEDDAVAFPNIFRIQYGRWEMTATIRIKLTAKSSAKQAIFMRVQGSTVEKWIWISFWLHRWIYLNTFSQNNDFSYFFFKLGNINWTVEGSSAKGAKAPCMATGLRR